MSLPSNAITFSDFSFWSEEEGFTNFSRENKNTLLRYTIENFSCGDIMACGTFLVLFCPVLPPIESRPFTIAGSVAVFIQEDDAVPADIHLGDFSGFNGLEVVFEDEVVKELGRWRLPSAETLLAVGRGFKDVEAVTFLNFGLIIELRAQERDAYIEGLETRPTGIKGFPVSLNYHDGVLDFHNISIRSEGGELDEFGVSVRRSGSPSSLSPPGLRYGDEFMMEGGDAGSQRLKCLGSRVRLDPAGEAGQKARDNSQLQGIYATSSPSIGKELGEGRLLCFCKAADEVALSG
ncbi:MAG: hypothetical protein Q9209_004443 [Squamulea sp. 1 TL-2023]